MSWLKLQQDGEHWTAFHPGSGLKVTASPAGQRLPRTRVPELLDVSVTDHCSLNCAFCYRDSRPGLPHATLENLRTVARWAAQAGVFEAALGGGEITEHPHFLEVLRVFSASGLTTNLTTRRPEEITRQWDKVSGLIGAFAVSVGSVGEIERLARLCRQASIPPSRVNLHLVLGTLQEHTYRALLGQAATHGFRVTLLGYKTTGRGEAFTPIPYAWWLSGLDLARTLGLGLSIDTAIAAEFQAHLLERGVDPRQFHTCEGRYSAFIDAVAMTFSPSSYEPWRGAVPFTEDWLERYAEFQAQETP